MRQFLSYALVTFGLVFGVMAKAGATSFLVVDHDRLMAEAQAAEKVRRDIESKRQNFQAELDAHEKSLRQEEEVLKGQETTLDEKEFTKRRLDFTKRVNMVHEKVSQRRQELEQGIQDARLQLVEKITEIVGQIAKEQRADVVLPKAGLVFSRPSLDVTDEVLKRLNALLPEVKIVYKKHEEPQQNKE